jgi:hypothetical protein
MSLTPDEHQQVLQEICDLFKEAEQAIKEVEDTGGELIVPAVNQLRYTGNHLIRYLSDPSCAKAADELADAAKHCKRATYDAYEAAILHQLMEYQKFKDDYRTTLVSVVIPNYSELTQQIEQARAFARSNNKSKTRGDFYAAGRDHLKNIVDGVSKLNVNRDELNKQIKRDRRNFIFQVFGGIVGVCAIINLILNFLKCQ